MTYSPLARLGSLCREGVHEQLAAVKAHVQTLQERARTHRTAAPGGGGGGGADEEDGAPLVPPVPDDDDDDDDSNGQKDDTALPPVPATGV